MGTHGHSQLWDTMFAKRTWPRVVQGHKEIVSLQKQDSQAPLFRSLAHPCWELLQPSLPSFYDSEGRFIFFLTRQFIHNSLTRRKINKVTVVLQRREETGIEHSDYQRVSSLQTRRARRFIPLVATHNLSWATSPAGPSCWTLELWQSSTAISHPAAANPITCHYSNARRETSVADKKIKRNKP